MINMDLLHLSVADAIENLKQTPDNSADLIILDPYYNYWEEFIEDGIIEESIRCLKESGNLLCFTQQPFDFTIRVRGNKYFRRELIWNYAKRPKWVSKKLPLVYHHKILWFVKSKKNHYFNCRSGLDYSNKTVIGNKGYMVFEGYKERLAKYEKHPEGVWIPDVLTFDKPFKTEYQGQKSLKLMEVLIRCFSPEGGRIIDPFIGYGTTYYATQKYPREVFGSDLNDKHFKEMLNHFKENLINDSR